MTTEEIIQTTRNLISEHFSDITFIEEGHKYFIGTEEYTPVSNIIENFVRPFDKHTISERYAEKNGRTQEDVLREWKYKNVKSVTQGTKYHEFGEAMTWIKCGYPELIPTNIRRQYIPEEGWLIPFAPKEESILKFYSELPPSIIPVGAEFRMSSKYIPEINTKFCGTTDLLFYYNSPDNPGFIIGDWKTNEELTKDYQRSKGITMYPPFDNLIDEPLGHYTLQFSMYQLMLESIGLKILGRRLIWLKGDGTYETIKIDNVSDKLLKIL